MCCEDCPSYSDCQEANLLSQKCCPSCTLYDICASPVDEYQEEPFPFDDEFLSVFDLDHENDALMEYQYLRNHNSSFDFDDDF